MSPRILIPLAVVLLLAVPVSAAPLAGSGDVPQFNRDVRPILAENCFACHGPDSAARKAKLRLDIREEALKAEAFVPGDPDRSAVVERIFSDEPSKLMPPAKSHKKLTAAQKETLKRWIAAGAEYQPHWALIAPKRPAPPDVREAGWVRNPIDRFILAELEKRGLRPAPEADRRTLARRVALDLIGLPPTPADVETFVNDPAPDAYERFVDRLLASPHWGEHRGRFWLDVARYADTHGIHFDNYRENYAYRDWVLDAFNRNLPFDQFTVEQLAGDLLPNPTLDQKIATGFNRCNITTNEGGTIPEEYLVLYTRDRTETTAAVWMGLTANCSVCHDHKFDPIKQREFYEMAAYFNNTTQQAMDGNIKDTPPVILVPRTADRARWQLLSKQIDELQKTFDARKQSARPDFDRWAKKATAAELTPKVPIDGLQVHAALDEGSGTSVQVFVEGEPRDIGLKPDALAWGAGHVAAKALKTRPAAGAIELPDAGDFEHDKGFSYGTWVRLGKNNLSGALFARMDDANAYRGWDLWVEGNRIGAHVIHKFPEESLKVVARDALRPNQWYHVFVTYDGSGTPAGLKVYVNGVPATVDVPFNSLKKNTIRNKVPLTIARRTPGSALTDVLLQDLRVYDRALPAEEVRALAKTTRAAYLVERPAAKRQPAEVNELLDWWTEFVDEQSRELVGKLNPLKREEAAVRQRGTVAHIMVERKEEPTAYVLYRGDYDKRRDQVKPGTPQALPPMPEDLPRNRLGFARWLLRPEHPLTARVTVNRFWQEVFGTGLVRTSGDFGVSGELPSHPELLDWLAVEFREGGWDVKKFFKLLVTSAAYCQAALMSPEKQEKDPQNRLLSRGPRYRMDAEMIRDCALASSGLLVRKLGGPSVKPYQPEGVWEAVAMIGSNTRDYRRDTGEGLYRRSLYTFWKRSAPPASMDILNAPSRETCAVRRERTNTPLQALVTLNDVQFVEAARHLAQVALKEGGDGVEGRLDFLAKRLLCRPFRSEEATVVRASLEDLLAHYKDHADDAKKLIAVGDSKADAALDPAALAAWTMLANELMNLDEVLNK